MSNETMTTTHDAAPVAEETPNYFVIFVILFVITAVEIALPLIGLLTGTPFNKEVETGLLLTLMVTKTALVIMFYMHLLTEKIIYAVVFSIPVLMAVFFMVMVSV